LTKWCCLTGEFSETVLADENTTDVLAILCKFLVTGLHDEPLSGCYPFFPPHRLCDSVG
jgi:hypothetical protein